MPACVAPEIRNAGPRYFSARAIATALATASSGGSRSLLLMHQPARLREQVLAELAELADDRSRIAHRIRIRIERRDIDEVQQHAGALQMLEETDAEARAFRGAFDEPGNVRHHEAALVAARDHAEIRIQRGERIVRDFRPRRGYGAKSASTCRRSAGLTSRRPR